MRVKRGVSAHAKHRKVKKQTKGMQSGRQASYRLGKQAVIRSLQHSYRDRRNRKRDFRQLWTIRINAGARQNGLTYSQLINQLKLAKIELNRKSLAEIAANEPTAFQAVVEVVKKQSQKK